jgi:hypothetical protein
MTNNRRTNATPTACAAWCDPKKHLLCGSPICCPHLHTVPRSTRKAKKRWTRSGW